MLRFAFSGWIALLALGSVAGQDLHFSQFYLQPLHHNPAQTGVFSGNFRAAALYRSQWSSVPVDYQTFSGSAEWKALRRRSNLVSVGVLIQHDRAGDAALKWTQAGLTLGVAHALGATQAVSVGFGLAGAQRAVDITALKFRNQWTGELYDPALPAKETFDRSSGLTPTLSAGLGWHWEPAGSRARASAGLAASHLNRPVVSFHDDGALRLPTRYSLQLGGQLPVGGLLDAVVFALGQQMGTAREIVAGGGLRRILNGNRQPAAVQFTLATRVKDAIIPAVQLEYGSWTVGVSYDWNTSDFEQATGGRGGPEIAVVYRPLPVPPVKVFKACPIF